MKKNLITLVVCIASSIGFGYSGADAYSNKAQAIITVLENRMQTMNVSQKNDQRWAYHTKLSKIRPLFPQRADFIELIDAVLYRIEDKLGLLQPSTSTQETSTSTQTTQQPISPTPSTPAAPVDSTLETIRQQMLELVNQERKKAGAQPLTLNTALNTAAQGHAYYMREADDFAHVNKFGQNFQDRADDAGYTSYIALGENIAVGQDTVAQVMQAWMNSQGHKKNIVDTKYKELGVGFYNEYWVQMFGATP